MSTLAITLDRVGDRLAVGVEDPTGDIVARGDVLLDVDETTGLSALLKALNADAYREDDYVEDERLYLQRKKLLVPAQGDTGRLGLSASLGRLVGEELFTYLFCEEKLRHAFYQAYVANGEVEIELKFSDDATLAGSLPWELLFYDDDFLFKGGRGTLVRRIEHSKRTYPRPPLHVDKLRVLLVSPRPAGLPVLDQLEADVLGEIDEVEIETLPRPTIRALGTYLLKHRGSLLPHVIHFDGHGVFGRRCGTCREISGRLASSCRNVHCPAPNLAEQPEGYLAWEDDEGGLQYANAQSLADRIGRFAGEVDSNLRLVVVSACRSSTATGGSAFSGVAQRLIKASVPAVLAMQFEVRANAAAEIAREFYSAIVAEDSLPRALSWARTQLDDVDESQWYRPVLYLRTSVNREDPPFALGAQLADSRPIVPGPLDRARLVAVPECEPTTDQERVEIVRQALVCLAALVTQGQEIAVALRQHVGAFSGVADRLQVMSDYKELHDHLHDLYHDCYAPVRDQLADLSESSTALRALVGYERSARRHVVELAVLAQEARQRVEADTLSWIPDLARIDEDLRVGIDGRNQRQVDSAVRAMGSLLATRPVQINEHLLMTVKALPVDQVSAALGVVSHDSLVGRGARAFNQLQARLESFAGEHNRWQRLEPELQQLDMLLITRPLAFVDDWPASRTHLQRLCEDRTEEEVGQLRTALADVDAALLSAVRLGQEPREADVRLTIQRAYDACTFQARMRFLKVDKGLKELCAQLRQLQDPMDALVDALGGVPT